MKKKPKTKATKKAVGPINQEASKATIHLGPHLKGWISQVTPFNQTDDIENPTGIKFLCKPLEKKLEKPLKAVQEAIDSLIEEERTKRVKQEASSGFKASISEVMSVIIQLQKVIAVEAPRLNSIDMITCRKKFRTGDKSDYNLLSVMLESDSMLARLEAWNEAVKS